VTYIVILTVYILSGREERPPKKEGGGNNHGSYGADKTVVKPGHDGRKEPLSDESTWVT